MNTSPVRTEVHGDVAVVVVDDGKVNALSFAVLDGLRTALADARDGAAVVLQGRPGVFCAGFDLAVMRGDDRDAVRRLLVEGGDLILDLLRHPAPVIAACTGHALAAGALLLLSCDVRIGQSGEFHIGLNEVAAGFPLPPMAITLASARLDPRRIAGATLLAGITGPEDAVEVGYLDRVGDDARADALASATSLAATLDRAAAQATKARVWSSLVEELCRGGEAATQL